MKKYIAVILALCLVLAFAACAKEEPAPTEAPTEAPVAVMSHDDYVAAELDTQVVVETYVQAHQSWWDNKITVYAQSEDGAYFLYNMACSEEDAAKLTEGTKIRVTGFKAEWDGIVEIRDATFEIIEGSFVAEPVDLTDSLASDELIAHQNEKVCFKGLTVVASNDAGDAFLYNWDGSGAAGNNNDLYFKVTDGTNEYTFTVESYLRGEGTDVYTAVTGLNVGDVVDVEGFLYWYEGVQPHVTGLTVVG